MDKIKLTIIIPVYNVALYIKECLDSFLCDKRIKQGLEVILVDDGSTDRSSEICKEYSVKYNFIKLVKQKNLGQSVARNKAINLAKGQWIAFIDSDDLVQSNYVSIIFNIIENCATTTDMVFFKYKKFKDISPNLDFKQFEKSRLKELSKDEAMYLLTALNDWGNYLWNKIYKREILQDNLLPEGKKYEDIGTLYKYVFNSKRIMMYNDILYFYRQREGSTVHSHDEQTGIDEFEARKKQLIFLKKHNYLKAFKRADHSFIVSCLSLMSYFPKSALFYTALNYVKKYKPNIKKDGLKLCLKVEIIRINPTIWIAVKKVKDHLLYNNSAYK